MTACHHFTGVDYINHKPCGAGIKNFGKLDLWPCIVHGRGFCDEHTTGQPIVKAEDMDNYADFGDFNS